MTTVLVLILAAGLIALAAADNISSVRRMFRESGLPPIFGGVAAYLAVTHFAAHPSPSTK